MVLNIMLRTVALKATAMDESNVLTINNEGFFLTSEGDVVAQMEEGDVLQDDDEIWHNIPDGSKIEKMYIVNMVYEEGKDRYFIRVTGEAPDMLIEDMKPMTFGSDAELPFCSDDEKLWKAKFKVNVSVQDMMDTYTVIQSEVEAANEDNPYDCGLSLVDDVFGMTLATMSEKVVGDKVEKVLTPLAAFNPIGKDLAKHGYVDSPEQLKEIIDGGYKPVIIGDGTGSGVGKPGAYRIDVLFVRKTEEELKTEAEEIVKAKEAEGPTIEEVCEEVISKKYVTRKELEMRIAYMRKNEVPEKHITRIISRYQAPRRPVSKPKKVYVDVKTGETTEPLIKRLVRNVVTGHNVILEGAKSVGKNVAIETMGWLMNMPVDVLKMSAQMTQDEMLGNQTTDNSAKDAISAQGAMALLKVLAGKSPEEAAEEAAKFLSDSVKCASTSLTFQLGLMAQWLVDGYGILVLDEMNMALANTLSRAVNSLADDHTEFYEIPGYGTVRIPEGCILYGTQNDSTYCGTNSQNDATYSRFQKIILPMPDTILDILKEGNPGVSAGVLKQCDDIFQEIRAEHNESLDPALSIRGILRALENVVEEQPLKEALIESVVNHVEDPEDRRVVLDILDRKIAD